MRPGSPSLFHRSDRVTLFELKEMLRKHYAREGNASWKRAAQAFAHLEAFFGTEARALSITKARVSDYQDARLDEEVAHNTIRYEVAIQAAAFGVAVEHDVLASMPVFKRLAPEREAQRVL